MITRTALRARPNQLTTEQAAEIERLMKIEANRVRSARLAAGYVVIKEAAEAVGFSQATYRHVETGFAPMSNSVAHACARAFDVSVEYLRSGVTKTPRERLAARIAAVLESFDDSAEGRAGAFPVRLRGMRIAAGFRTAKEAAESNGWQAASYSTHEAGSYPAPVDRMIGYALAYGFRPEFAVLGKLPEKGDLEVKWVDRRGQQKLSRAAEVTPWKWLREDRRAGVPLLLFSGRAFRLANERLVLPKETVGGARALSSMTYAVVQTDHPGDILLVDPSALSSDRMVFADIDAGLLVKGLDGATDAAQDPLQAKLRSELLLGKLVARISLTMA